MPKKKEKGSKLFGIKLENKAVVPEHLEQLLTELEKKGGIETEGIFRISGSVPMVKKLKEAIDEGEKVAFSEYSVHDVAGVTKMYFRELPEPLFTFRLYGCFIAAGASGDKEEISKAVGLLPVGNRAILNRLLSFLYKVVQLSNVNKMVPENLATCLVPNLLRQKNETMESTISDYPFLINLFTELIDNYEYYFKKEIDEQKKKKDAMREKALNYKKMMEEKYKKNEPKENSPPPSPRTEEEQEIIEETPTDVNFRNTMTAKYEKINSSTLKRLNNKQAGTTAMEFQAMLQDQFQRIQSGDVSIQEIRDLLEVPSPPPNKRSTPPAYDPPKPPVPARKPPPSSSIHNTLPSPSFRYSLDITGESPVDYNNFNNNFNNSTNNTNTSNSAGINHTNHHLANALEAGRNRSWTSFEGLNSEANPNDIRELLKTLPSIPSQLSMDKINATGSPKPPPRPPRK